MIYLSCEVINMGGNISKDNTRTNITIPKTLKAELEALAKQDQRSFNNLVIKILTNYAEKMRKEGKIPDNLPIDDGSDK